MTRGKYAARTARLAALAAAVELRQAELDDPYHGNEPNAPCRDCRTDTLPTDPDAGGTEYYGVDSRVWKAAGMEPNGGCLCIGCLEQRLGRRLWPADFTGADINSLDPGWQRRGYAWAYRTQRLTDRLTGQLALWEDQ
jgi:hypothetical protein